jgi:hypothetical protein
MSSYPDRSQPTFRNLLRSFASGDDGPGLDLLDPDTLDRLAQEHGLDLQPQPDQPGAADVWTVPLTLWAFLVQVVSATKTCVAAVGRVIALRLALELPPCSAATGGYCRARQRLPEPFLRDVAFVAGDDLERASAPAWRWHGRHVFLIDGSTVTAEDTPANQDAYPQPAGQRRGLGFPLLRVVALFALASGAIVGAEVGPCRGRGTGEVSLAVPLLGRLRPGDILVGDRAYCSYGLIALALTRGIDVVARLHQNRRRDGGGRHDGARLPRGQGDVTVVWHKPAQRPAGMDADTWASLPQTLVLREVAGRVCVPGFRTREVVAVTTLSDPAYGVADLLDLYRQRWHSELDLRSLKQQMKMKHLVCKTPAMVRKELWAHLLGYNLIRRLLADAASSAGLPPRHLSVAGALQELEALRDRLQDAPADRFAYRVEVLWRAVASHRVGYRPDRVEPRRLKRRPSKYGQLGQERSEARAALLAQAV